MCVDIKNDQFLVIGRAGMDLYADPPGTPLPIAKKFTAMLGGSAANIAAGISRQGGKVDLVTSLSTDSVGDFVLEQLRQFGIGDALINRIGGEVRSSLAVVETRTENCKSVIYRNAAADLSWSEDRAKDIDYARYGAVIVTGTVFAAEPSRSAGFAALKAASAAGVPIVLDIDYRPYSWASSQEATDTYQQVAALSHVLIGNDEEFEILAGDKHRGLDYARNAARISQKTVVYKRGKLGSYTFDGQTSFKMGVYATEALKPTGAGDAFMSAFVMALFNKEKLENCVMRGSAAAALVVSRVGCSDAMPTQAEIDDVVKYRRFLRLEEAVLDAFPAL